MDGVIVYVLYEWALWEVKRAGISIHEAIQRQWFKFMFKTRHRKWWIAFKLWEYKHMVGELLALVGWRIKALLWHIRNRSRRGLITLGGSHIKARDNIKRQRRELVTHLRPTERLGNLYATLFLVKGIWSKDMDVTVKEVMVPFHVYAWVYGYWSCLFEKSKERQAKRRKTAA
jgi:hypothetical protein